MSPVRAFGAISLVAWFSLVYSAPLILEGGDVVFRPLLSLLLCVM